MYTNSSEHLLNWITKVITKEDASGQLGKTNKLKQLPTMNSVSPAYKHGLLTGKLRGLSSVLEKAL